MTACQVLLINAADGSKEFNPRDRAGAQSVCDLILELKPEADHLRVH